MLLIFLCVWLCVCVRARLCVSACVSVSVSISRQGACTEAASISRRFHAYVDHICVEKIRARVDQRPVVIDEKTPAVVIFKSPPFKAAARVSIPGQKMTE